MAMELRKATSSQLGRLKDATKLIEELSHRLKDVGCTSVTLCVRDPMFPYYFRTMAHCGVLIREVMYGPLRLQSAVGEKLTLPPYEDEEHFEWIGPEDIPSLIDKPQRPTSKANASDPLYLSFIEREDVRSTAIKRFFVDGEFQACVFVNFGHGRGNANQKITKAIRSFSGRFQKLVPHLLREIASHVPARIKRIENLHMVVKQFPISESGTTIEKYLDSFLKAVIENYDVGEDGFAAIYLAEENLQGSRVLRKCVQRGAIARTAKSSFSVGLREGLISVAAQTLTPLIVDHPSAKFEQSYVSVDIPNAPLTTRQLAVPLYVGEHLTGVMNIETKKEVPGFDEQDVFDITSMGFRVASSIRVATQIASNCMRSTMALLEIAARAISDDGNSALRDSLQEWARSVFNADDIAIWQWSTAGKHFVPEGHPESPRERGFSKLIYETREKIWWTKSADPDAMDVVYWNDELAEWTQSSSKTWLPDGVNGHLKGDDIVQQLGLPIVFRDRCVGVVWFKFRERNASPPMLAKMQLAMGIAAQIGVILQLNRRHDEFRAEAAVDCALSSQFASICQTGEIEFKGGTGYAIVCPSGPIGGDFIAKSEFNHATSFMIGDGEGHGILGATKMLPIHTAFKAVSQRVRSPRQTLLEMCEMLQCVDDVRGTAIAFVVDCSRENPRLIVSSAAHPKLMVVRKGGESHPLPEGEQEGFQIGVPMDLYYDQLLDESRYDLKADDILIGLTDGVLEAGSKGESGPFNIDRIVAIVHEKRSKSPKEIAEEIQKAMLRHCDHEIFDDYTILVLRIAGK